MRTLGLFLVVLAGCTRPLSIGGGDDGGTQGDCGSHHDANSCGADSACVSLTCPSCSGPPQFIGCYDKNGPLPGIGCGLDCASCHGLTQDGCAAAFSSGCHAETCCGSFVQCLDPGEQQVCTLACTSCHGLSESSCTARSDCRADYCPDCNGGSSFVGCENPSDPLPQCPAIPCPPPPPACATLGLNECSARSDCHSVYQQGACGCAACCCMAFELCAPNGKADCAGPATCKSLPPDCNSQLCNAQYVISYANNCYEGCVLASECK
jgi:hypothetical protein